MTEARYRGQKVVVVSPDFAGHTKFADHWLPAQASDGALALAMAHVDPEGVLRRPAGAVLRAVCAREHRPPLPRHAARAGGRVPPPRGATSFSTRCWRRRSCSGWSRQSGARRSTTTRTARRSAHGSAGSSRSEPHEELMANASFVFQAHAVDGLALARDLAVHAARPRLEHPRRICRPGADCLSPSRRRRAASVRGHDRHLNQGFASRGSRRCAVGVTRAASNRHFEKAQLGRRMGERSHNQPAHEWRLTTARGRGRSPECRGREDSSSSVGLALRRRRTSLLASEAAPRNTR